MDKRPNTVRTSKKLQATDKAEMTCKRNPKHAQKQLFWINLHGMMCNNRSGQRYNLGFVGDGHYHHYGAHA